MNPVRVLVVDDHALFRRGLVELLSEEEGIEVVGEASGASEALRKADDLAPDLVFLDVNMPETDGVVAAAALTERHPEIMVVMLTVSEDPDTLFAAMEAGARGYVLKNASPTEILDVLQQVAQGWVVISPAMAPLFLRNLQPREAATEPEIAPPGESLTGLSRRESEILRLIARAYTNREIADELTVTVATVKTHVRSILGKLRVNSKRGVMARAQALGLLRDEVEDGATRHDV